MLRALEVNCSVCGMKFSDLLRSGNVAGFRMTTPCYVMNIEVDSTCSIPTACKGIREPRSLTCVVMSVRVPLPAFRNFWSISYSKMLRH